ncbi:amidohydrolase/deacetylase family metallohydrolase [Gracilibacillus salinarum]|uniref:Amidohydrolase/deacetylase family metallohydrolase n=1 Tax=Gracilibacillus salinarum TaxID=2932255 RepID=A0ABY4GT05_9BACI|nr:amidohydrolase/deacetylase family metallohydrolase [Gracilibacillus salinarum]UOQ87523.1 amidohydrolase/deacetylase family metallohydrolase [Gracilibacillus salinarum]
MNERYVLRNVKRVSGEMVDIVIKGGKIAEITEAGNGEGTIIECSGAYVSSGWIDLHVHAFPEFDPYGDEADEIGVKQGVTTIVDAGSCGADRFAELVESRDRSKTNLYAFLNVSKIGLERVDELSKLEWLEKDKAVQTVNKYHDVIVGLKVRMSKSVVGDNGIKPLRVAREIAKQTSLPLMVHIGSGPPNVEEVIPLLEKRDVITHYLNGKENNLFDRDGKPLQVLIDAIERGVHLDVGHGTSSYSFKVAEDAKKYNIRFDTISTDIYRGNRINGPVYSMGNVLSKFLHLGYSLENVIASVTTHAAKWLDKPELGRIKTDDLANLTIFDVKHGRVTLEDSVGYRCVADRKIEAKGVVVNGEYIEC